MLQTSFIPVVRVAVISQNRVLDLALPTNIPIRDVIISIEPLLAVDLQKDTFPTAKLTLGRLGQIPFNPDTTLGSVGVVDGDLLVFQSHIDPEDISPSVIEDVAQLSSLISFPSIGQSRSFFINSAFVQFLIASIFLSGVLCAFRYYAANIMSIFLFVSNAIISIALLCMGFFLNHRKKRGLSALYVLGGLITIPALSLWPYRHVLSLDSIFCVLIVVHCLSWLVVYKFSSYRALWTMILVTTGASIPIVAISAVWHVPSSIIGCFLFLCSLVYQLYASTIAILFAPIPLSRVPAIGDHEIEILSKTALEKMNTKLVHAGEHQNGIIAGSMILQMASSFFFFPTNWVGWLFISLSVLGTLLRSRIWANHIDKMWLLSSALLIPTVLIIKSLWVHNLAQTLILSLIFLIITFIYIGVFFSTVLTSQDTYALVVRHMFTLISYALDVILVLGSVYLTGLFSQVLHR